HEANHVVVVRLGIAGEAIDTPSVPHPVACLVMVALRGIAVARLQRLSGGEVASLLFCDLEQPSGRRAFFAHGGTLQEPQRNIEVLVTSASSKLLAQSKPAG